MYPQIADRAAKSIALVTTAESRVPGDVRHVIPAAGRRGGCPAGGLGVAGTVPALAPTASNTARETGRRGRGARDR